MTILSTAAVSSDATNPTPEPTKAVKSAKQLAAAEALKAISSALSPERGVKAKAHRDTVAANNKERLGKKLALLTAGNFEHKGKRKTLNLRQTLIEMAKAVRVGATAEQLALTGVLKRFNWATIEAPVRAYAATLEDDMSKVVLAVLYPAPAVEAPKSETQASPAPAKADKPAAKKTEAAPKRAPQAVRKAG